MHIDIGSGYLVSVTTDHAQETTVLSQLCLVHETVVVAVWR